MHEPSFPHHQPPPPQLAEQNGDVPPPPPVFDDVLEAWHAGTVPLNELAIDCE
jgi:hypothetical protein